MQLAFLSILPQILFLIKYIKHVRISFEFPTCFTLILTEGVHRCLCFVQLYLTSCEEQ